MRNFLALIAVAIVCFIFVACENSNNATDNSAVLDEDNNVPDNDVTESKPFIVKGMVAKGPLVKGSAIYFTILSETGEQEGLILNAITDDDMGRFSYKVTETVAPNVVGKVCKISATGYFYDEIADRLSNAPITLEALFRITDTEIQDARINLLTHMTVKRTLQLMDGGTVFETAQAQAESELIDQMGVFYAPEGEDPKPAIQMDITADPYPLAVACIFNQAAFNTAKDDAEFYGKYQQLLNDTAADLSDGVLTDKIKEIIVAGEKNLDADACVANLKKYLEEKTGETKILPDPNESVDTNKDGVPNVSDPDIDGDGVENAMDCVNGEAPYLNMALLMEGWIYTQKRNHEWVFQSIFTDENINQDFISSWNHDFSDFVSGHHYACGLVNSKIWCWADLVFNTMVQVNANDWEHIYGAKDRLCALNHSKDLYCWNTHDENNTEFISYSLSSEPVLETESVNWISLSLGNEKIWGVQENGTLWSWDYEETPVLANDTEEWKTISNNSMYAIKKDGSLWYFNDLTAPLQIGTDTDWKIVIGTCAIKNSNTTWCWDENSYIPTEKKDPAGSCGEWKKIIQIYGTYCGQKTDNSIFCFRHDDTTFSYIE